jgi:hypothetical protein
MCATATDAANRPARTAARIGHQIANKLTAQLILADLLAELTEGEVAELARQLADELRGIGELTDRLQALGRDDGAAQLPD